MEKKREPNFTIDEKLHLFNIISRYSDVLENKKTDKISIAIKNNHWQMIEEEFNSSPPASVFRKATTLKILYENKKKELRKKIAEEKRQTGGESETIPKIKTNPIDQILTSIINEKSMHGLQYVSDSNNGSQLDESECSSECDIKDNIIEFEVVSCDEDYNSNNKGKKRNAENDVSCLENISCTDDPSSSSSVDPCDPENNRKRYKPADLQSLITETPLETPLEKKTTSTMPSTSRRRSKERALTSSDVDLKHDLLMDKKLVLVDKQIELLNYEKEERKLRIELLQLQIAEQKRFKSFKFCECNENYKKYSKIFLEKNIETLGCEISKLKAYINASKL